MKLVIQIPCYDEAETLAGVLASLPRAVDGFDTVEWLVVDDGSVDATADVARAGGVDHVVRHVRNQGLARAFMTGLDTCLGLGADVVVNTDADDQYDARDIPALVKPILEGRADIVVGTRPIGQIEHFSAIKKALHRLGSRVVARVSGTDIADAPSGFRGFSRRAIQKLMVFGDYTYTLETIIQAGQDNLAIVSVPVRTNPETRASRLITSLPSYVVRSISTILRIVVIYRPFRFFVTIGAILFGLGTLIGLRFVWLFLVGDGGGHVQSLILAAILLGMGFQAMLIAFVADLLAANRKLLMDVRFRLNRLESRDTDKKPAAKNHRE